MQIFAYTENPEFHALLEVEVKEITGRRPVVRTTFEELTSLLGIFQTIECLIVDANGSKARKEDLKFFLEDSQGTVKQAIVVGTLDVQLPHVKFVDLNAVSEVFDEIRRQFSPEEKVEFSWSGMPVEALVHFESLPFDLFIKLSDDRYVKRIPAFEKVDVETIKAFQAKNLNTLYFDRKFNRDFSMMLINNMINKVDRSYPTIPLKMKANEEVFETTKQIIQTLGLKGRVVDVCDASIDSMCNEVLADPSEFSEHLKNLKADRSLSFQFRLITLTNYIGTQLILETGMANGDEQVKKLIFSSYFCDMTLKNPGYLYHRTTESVNALGTHEQSEVNFHALKASHLVAQYKDAPAEVSLIIQQHHGSFSGIGFPKEKSPQLHPLAKILIVAQDLAFAILADESAPAMEVLRRFLRQNRCSGLQELLDALEGTLAPSKTSKSA